jgi:phage FluMu gp28-like protein
MTRGRRMAIDKTGMGLALYEELDEKFYGQIEGVTFTLETKEALAVHGKQQMEHNRTMIPDTDMIRNSFRSVKKVTTATGHARFDAEHDTQFGHADHWWAYCLAQSRP